jgi:uncharacterized protein YndB with AHSA1/START domain
MADRRAPYEIVSHWKVAGRIEDVFAVLTDAPSLPRWWPEAYTQVREITAGDASGQGRVVAIVTRGFLPYQVRWQMAITKVRPPEMIRLEASGDVVGIGEWRLRAESGGVALSYDWRVATGKPWMQRLELVLKPLFAVNHNGVMRRGEAGLRAELARRGFAETPP